MLVAETPPCGGKLGGRRVRPTFVLLLISLVLSSASFAGSAQAAGKRSGPAATSLPRPPDQPESGPGGSAPLFERVIATRNGEQPVGYWLFEPSDATDQVESGGTLPLVLFLHGFNALDPIVYRAWIDHIVRRGAVVVYPDYQEATLLGAKPLEYLGNLLTGVRSAVDALDAGDHPPVDLSRVAVVGHSLGGIMAANYAAVAESQELPIPAVLMPVEPGGCRGCGGVNEQLGAPLAPLDNIPEDVLALVVVGAEDDFVGDMGGRLIWSGMTQVPLKQRDFVTLVGDARGQPPLEAGHLLPQTAGAGAALDAMDWYGTWKLFDALTSCAFDERWCDTALGDSASQRFMGIWSDGVPVAEAQVTDDPAPPNPR